MARTNARMQIVLLTAGLAVVVSAAGYFGLSFLYDGLYLVWPSLFDGAANAGADDFWLWLNWGSLAAVTIVIAVFAGLVGWWFSHRMVAPMLEVAKAVRKVARGDLTARASLTKVSFGEGAGLIEDFNNLAERLERSQEELRYQNSAIAHELRTPLTILKGQLQGVSDGVFSVSAEMVDRLIDQVDGLTRIVGDLSTLSLLETGRMSIRPVPIDLKDVAEDVVELVRSEFETSGMFLQLKLSSAPANADPMRMRQALLALCINATRYAGGTVLDLTTGVEGEHAIFACRDHGPGLGTDALKRSFEPFWRADGSRTREKGGSGLGLAVVKAIALAHGGSVEAGNAAGGGAVFTLRLPLLRAEGATC